MSKHNPVLSSVTWCNRRNILINTSGLITDQSMWELIDEAEFDRRLAAGRVSV